MDRYDDQPLGKLLDAVASSAPTPGGGTVAAGLAACGCALGEMVARLTLGKEQFKPVEREMEQAAERFRALRAEFLTLMVDDARSFDGVIAARRLPKSTPEQQRAREEAIASALDAAARVPVSTAERAVEALSLLATTTEKGNPNAASDAGAGALACHAGCLGALLNVRINAAGLPEPARNGLLRKADALKAAADRHLHEALDAVRARAGI